MAPVKGMVNGGCGEHCLGRRRGQPLIPAGTRMRPQPDAAHAPIQGVDPGDTLIGCLVDAIEHCGESAFSAEQARRSWHRTMPHARAASITFTWPTTLTRAQGRIGLQKGTCSAAKWMMASVPLSPTARSTTAVSVRSPLIQAMPSAWSFPGSAATGGGPPKDRKFHRGALARQIGHHHAIASRARDRVPRVRHRIKVSLCLRCYAS